MLAYRADRAFDGERLLPAGTLVLVDGSRIVGVDTAAPAGTPVLDLPGCTLLPGLIDAHVHLCGDGGPEALARVPDQTATERTAVIERALRDHARAGVTTVRDLGDHHWAVVGHRASGPRDGEPRLVVAGPPITTPGGHCASMGGEAAGRPALVAAVRRRAERGVDVVKIMVSGGAMTAGSDLLVPQYDSADVAAVVDAAHALGLPVTAHAHATESVRACLAAGVDGIEHCTCLSGAGLDRPDDLFRGLAAAGTVVCPTLGRVPGSVPSPQLLAVVARLGFTLTDRLAQLHRLVELGVQLISGSDAGIHSSKPHGVLPESIAELVAAGVAPTAALTSATAAAADACGLAGVTGRLRPGLDADLLVVGGDPTTRIADLRAVRRVLIRGREVTPGPPPPAS